MVKLLAHTATVAGMVEAKLTTEQKRAHVEAYLKSGLGPTAYCQAQDLKLSTFKNWVTRYQAKSHLRPKFVPVVLTPPKVTPEALNMPSSRIEIHHRGCNVVIDAFSNVTTVMALIQGVLQCS